MGRLSDSANPRERTIHVWTAQLLDDDDAAAEFAGILDEDERERARRLRFEQHRNYFIQSHGIVRQVLASYTGINAAALTFHHGPHGKPSVALPGWELEFHFSLSHSGNCCMVAVRSGHPVGIDVERVHDLPNAAEIAQCMFTREESEFLARLTGAARRDAFFALWTAKEAVVKALGRSLADSLDRVRLDLDPDGTVRLVSLEGDASSPAAWSVTPVDAPAGFVAALAASPGFATVRHFAWQGARQCCAPADHPNSPPHLDDRSTASLPAVLA